MKSLLLLSIWSVLLGLALGIALAYIEVRPWSIADMAKNAERRSDPVDVSQGRPRAEVPERVYAFGKMERGATMSHAFIVRNVGEQPLTLEVVSTTCKCTVGDLEQNQVAPGEDTEVLLEWTAKTQAGPFRHGAGLQTNDPGNSRIELTVEGEVVESTSLIPADLYFGDIRVGETGSAEMFLISNLQPEVEVMEYEFSDPKIADQVTLEMVPAEPGELPVPDAVSGVKIRATYQAGQSIGRFRGWLELHTNLKTAPKQSVLVAGSTIGDISIFGPGWVPKLGLLRMGSVSSRTGTLVKLNIAVRGASAQATALELVEIDPPALGASLGEARVISEELVHIPLVVALPAGTAPIVRTGEPASSDAFILLKSSNPDATEVRLRVHFSVGG